MRCLLAILVWATLGPLQAGEPAAPLGTPFAGEAYWEPVMGYDWNHYRYSPIDYHYQVYDGQPAEGGVGFLSAALKVTVPLECLSTENVHTTLYGAAQYYRFVNQGLLDGNQSLGATSRREQDVLQFHLGVSVSF